MRKKGRITFGFSRLYWGKATANARSWCWIFAPNLEEASGVYDSPNSEVPSIQRPILASSETQTTSAINREKQLNKHTQQLMQHPKHILQSRVEALKAELVRDQESRPIKLLAFVAVFLSLYACGGTFGFDSLVFILPALFIALYAGVIAIGAWGLRSNLRDSEAALKLTTS
jgi:hypothetical protein